MEGKTNGEKMYEAMVFQSHFYGIAKLIIVLGVIGLIIKFLFF